MAPKMFYRNRFALGCITCLLLAGCQAKKTDNSVKVTYLHHYGLELADEQDWMDRGGNGEIVRNLKNGVVIREKYRDGLLQGETIATFPHSDTIKRVATYNKGVLVSEVINYISGVPQEKKQFLANGRTLVTLWYEDNVPQAKEEYQGGLLVNGEYFNHDGHSEACVTDGMGIRTLRDGQGNLVAQETIVKGQLSLAELYHPNGAPRERIPYCKGKIDGIKKVFLIGGEPSRFEEWQQGVLHGTVQVYENGEKVAEVPYKIGKREGVELRFRPGTDMVVEEIAWSHDKRHGSSVAIIDGMPVTVWYYEGRKVSKPQYLELVSRSFYDSP